MNRLLIVTALVLGGGTAAAQGAKYTLDGGAIGNFYSAGLAEGSVAETRLTVDLPWGDTARAELVDERRFGVHGGIAAAGYTWAVSPDWLLAGTLALGHGGPIWADVRAEVEVTRKWLADRSLATRLAFYRAEFREDRRDQGLRLSAVGYLPRNLVVEAGVVVNVSAPGSVRSQMPFASVTWGREGDVYVSATLRSGRESYQALAGSAQLVDFHSSSARFTWRGWLGRQWGLTLQGENYTNPYYKRATVGAGAFAQW